MPCSKTASCSKRAMPPLSQRSANEGVQEINSLSSILIERVNHNAACTARRVDTRKDLTIPETLVFN
jgi:hypothetical protein